jgi:hypothetical protein
MKNLLLILPLLFASLGLSSCCSLFGSHSWTAGYTETTHKKQICGYDTEEVVVDSKSGMTETKKVPRYKTVTVRTRIPCPQCVRHYCPTKDCCGSTSDATIKLATAQGSSGSPSIGLLPTMKPIKIQ